MFSCKNVHPGVILLFIVGIVLFTFSFTTEFSIISLQKLGGGEISNKLKYDHKLIFSPFLKYFNGGIGRQGVARLINGYPASEKFKIHYDQHTKRK